jgi:hypothetical protein
MSVKYEDLSPENRRRVDLQAKRPFSLPKEEALAKALKVLEAIPHLSQKECRRVLQYALTLNDL